MVQIGFSRCLVWFMLASVHLPSSFELSARTSGSEKYPRHDKNWWFWNQEAKEKMGTFEDTQKKEDKDIKLEFKRTVHPFTPDVGLLRSLLSKAPLNNHMNKKRWLSGSSRSFGKKNQHKQSGKWLIDSQLSGSNVLSTTPVIQDQLTMPRQEVTQIQQEDYKTEIPLRKFSAGSKDKSFRKHKFHPKKISLQHQNTKEHRALNVDNILFGSPNHTYKLGSGSFQQLQGLTEQSTITYGNRGPYQQVWNKSHDPVWDRFMTPFEELRDNPLRHPYPFHDSRSSIKWYTTPNYGLIKTSEPPYKEQDSENNRQLHPSVENGNGDFYEIMERKGVGKSLDKKSKELTEQRHHEHELIPRIYALNQLRNGKRGYNKYKNNYGWPADSFLNPIIVPGFKRKHTDDAQTQDSYDKPVILRPNIIHTEEQKNPFEEEFIQISRANRNQAKNILGIKDNRQVTASSVPMQMPSPYAFPGGVNISILVPNPPALSSYETQPLSTMPSTSTDKNNKKKKERKKKVKTYDELHENLLSEPRSFASAHVNLRKFPYAEKVGIDPLIGDDDRKMREKNLIKYRPQLNNATGYIKQPMFDLKSENFSMLSQIRNLTMNPLNWDAPLLGIQTEKGNKPADYSEDDDDDDEISMLYDEQTSSTTPGLDKKQQTVSFSWYRLTEYFPNIFSTQESWGNGKLSTPPNIKRLPGSELRGSSRGASSLEYENYPSHTNYTCMDRTFKRSARDEIRGDNHDDGRIKPNKHRISQNKVKHDNYNENMHLDGNDPNVMPKDQWDALDEDLISKASVNNKDVAWQTKNRKRETDYYDHQANDEQGYYRLSVGGNSFRNPTNLIMSVLRAKSKPRERDYYDDAPEERIREQMPKYDVPSTYPK